jgi:cytochrome c oxidase subunit 2
MNDLAATFNPASPQAEAISHLFTVTLVVCGLMRFRWREGERDPSQVAGNRKVEIVWTVIPFLIVVLLFVMTARTMSFSDPPPAPNRTSS